MIEFKEFPKIARLSRKCTITEKIDGTNASVYIGEYGTFLTGSRSRWITPQEDNYGFSKWAHERKEELLKLGHGHHFGEWWGSGCQRGYGLTNGEKRWSLFNTKKWINNPELPCCCHVVPVLYEGMFETNVVWNVLEELKYNGSKASPNFINPEGVVIWHKAGQLYFKKTIEKDDEWKGKSK